MISSIVNAVKTLINIPLPLIIVLLGTTALGYAVGTSVSDDQWQSRWSDRDAADATARAEQEARNREAENTMQHAITKVSQNAEQKLTSVQADADNAAAAAGRLRGTISELQRKLQRSEALADSAIASERQAEARAANMFANLLTESVERNRQLAAAADDARTRGLTCEQAYDVITRASQ